jgi:hypothetical protein
MVKFSAEQIQAWEESQRKREEAELALVRLLIEFGGMWVNCANRECRRIRGCADARACRKTHAEGILRWKREVMLPWARRRYPTVQWGAPAGVVEPQFKAALAAEAEEQARREGRTDASGNVDPAPRPRKQRVPRQPLYDPGDV